MFSCALIYYPADTADLKHADYRGFFFCENLRGYPRNQREIFSQKQKAQTFSSCLFIKEGLEIIFPAYQKFSDQRVCLFLLFLWLLIIETARQNPNQWCKALQNQHPFSEN